LPLTFASDADYDALDQGDEWQVANLRSQIQAGKTVTVHNLTKGKDIHFKHALTERQIAIVLDGGLLNHIKKTSSP
jgi:aconitate hydratase